MDETILIGTIENFDRRLERVEQFLPSLATKDELRDAIDKLATTEELQAEMAQLRAETVQLATREELRAEVATLATKDELRATRNDLEAMRSDLGERIERARLESRMLYESLKDDIRLVAEGVVNVQRSMDEIVRPTLANHERRISHLEPVPPSGHRRRGRR
jgi:benzoyl-CoA reductase/2-hydroxyglutaryl-CoA dehydratase subunit BcrC/BadD/HgdB